MAKDIYVKKDDPRIAKFNPLLDSLLNVVQEGNIPEFNKLIRQIESGGKYLPLKKTTEFPMGNPLARAKTSQATGVYQFTPATVKTTKQRALNLGIDSAYINLIPDDPTQWTDKEAEVMFMAHMFAAQVEGKEGFIDSLLKKSYVEGDRAAMHKLYYDIHHTDPDEATRKRVEQIMPILDK